MCCCLGFFNSYRSFVSEDAGPNTLIATVNAVDPDGDGVTYDIQSGNQKGNFVVDPKKGNYVLALCCCGHNFDSVVMHLLFGLTIKLNSIHYL